MERFKLAFSRRYLPLTIAALISTVIFMEILVAPATSWLLILAFLVFAAMTLLGISDLRQDQHAILRNYPISGHARYLMEELRPKIRQYFFEGENDGRPFSRDKRALVYQRAKGQLDKRPFGTEFDVYDPGYEWISHSMTPAKAACHPITARTAATSFGKLAPAISAAAMHTGTSHRSNSSRQRRLSRSG